jgi:two-component system response regulator PilR (NtrC family)
MRPTSPSAGALDPPLPELPEFPPAPLGYAIVPESLCAPDSPMNAVLEMTRVFAQSASPVLIRGESGTGKEVFANLLHAFSRRKAGPFVALNCAAISHGLIESELFGHRKGAFTHAVADRPGHIRQAHGGTLFLDEIGDMPLDLQASVLRVLQEKKVRPLGGDEERAVDFRLVCATHRNLGEEVRAGRFREDLYYRLQVLELRLPPLRARPMDIPFLLRGFLAELGMEKVDEALERLPEPVLAHPFPGNVRELRNLAERYAALRGMGFGWDLALVPALEPRAVPNAADALKNSRLKDEDVVEALKVCDYHRGRAAERLGITRRALQYRLVRMRVKAGI